MELKDYLSLQNKRKKPHRQEESEIQMAVVRWLKLNHPTVLFSSALGGIKTTMGQAVKLKRLGYVRGLPDLLIFEPRGGFHGLMLELKTPSGQVSVFQKEFLKNLHDRGYRGWVSFSYEDAVIVIEDYLSGKWEAKANDCKGK